jgi:biopolymer transport protein ExbD
LIFLMLGHVSTLIPIGLTVHLLRPGPAAAMSPGIQPLLVQVAAGPQWFGVRVDPKLVVWDDLPTLLSTELMRRPPEWPVYVEGDPAMDWQYVVQVIDVIEGVGGRVVLLTTRPGSESAGRR